MVNPANLFRMMTEFIFILLGGFLVWLGLSNRFLDPANFNPRSPAWLGSARCWSTGARAPG